MDVLEYGNVCGNGRDVNKVLLILAVRHYEPVFVARIVSPRE